jgi:GNAT superfamily N-acetyltransferase
MRQEMKTEILSSNDSRLTKYHIEQAVRIAEDAFKTQSDQSQMEIGDSTIRWTLAHIPKFWSLILIADECVGGAALLPSTKTMMNSFLAGEITESTVMEFAQANIEHIHKFDCLYVAGITVRPGLQGRDLGTRALTHAIESAQAVQPNCKTLFTWIYSDSGARLIARLQTKYTIHTFNSKAA